MGGISRERKELMGLWTDVGSLGLSNMHHNTSIKIAWATYLHRLGENYEVIANKLSIQINTAKNYVRKGKHLTGRELQFWIKQKSCSAWHL